MKSDREFLDGIYEKAEKILSEQTVIVHNTNSTVYYPSQTYRKWMPAIAACLLLFIAIPSVYLAFNMGNKTTSLDEVEMDFGADTATPSIQQFAQPAAQDIQGEQPTAPEGIDNRRSIVSQEIVVTGKLEAWSLSTECGYLLLEAFETEQSIISGKVFVKVDLNSVSLSKEELLIGEEFSFIASEGDPQSIIDSFNIDDPKSEDERKIIDTEISNYKQNKGTIWFCNLVSIGAK